MIGAFPVTFVFGMFKDHTLNHERPLLNNREHFFYCEGEHRHWFPEEVVEVPCLNVLKKTFGCGKCLYM